MKKTETNLLYYILGSALIWGATIIGCSILLKTAFSQISLLLTSTATVHLIVIWGALTSKLKKQRMEVKCK